MIYGKIFRDAVIPVITTDEQGNWKSGSIYHDNKGNRLTAADIIHKYGLKPITVPPDFKGNYGDYSFVESDTEIILGALTKAARERLQAAELDVLRQRRERECFSYINRGAPWYDLLTAEQEDDLNAWYIQWLNVTETKQPPELPESLRGIIK